MPLTSTNAKLRSRMPSPANSNANALAKMRSLSGKKKGILKQMIKPALNGNKFRGIVKPKMGMPKTDMQRTPISPGMQFIRNEELLNLTPEQRAIREGKLSGAGMMQKPRTKKLL